jgi:hypothetical protein
MNDYMADYITKCQPFKMSVVGRIGPMRYSPQSVTMSLYMTKDSVEVIKLKI